MGRDESGTLARLREHRKERLEPVVARYSGRLVKLTGDGALVVPRASTEGDPVCLECIAPSEHGKFLDHIGFRLIESPYPDELDGGR
jgi:class 3 adenylate cyclase